MDVTGRKPVKSPARQEQTNDSSAPIWKTLHNRVQGAMWKHLQDDGTVRFTISVSRSYKDKDTDKWMNVHYFDRNDLRDVHAVCAEAEEQILSAEGMEQEVGED